MQEGFKAKAEYCNFVIELKDRFGNWIEPIGGLNGYHHERPFNLNSGTYRIRYTDRKESK